MSTVKITDLTALTDPSSTDVLPVVDVGASATKKLTIADLMENAGSGSAATPGISFDGDPDSGIARLGANNVAICTAGTNRLDVGAAGVIDIKLGGSASTPALIFEGDVNTGISHSADTLTFSTSGTAAITVDASQRVGVGTTSPNSELNIVKTGASDEPTLRIQSENSSIFLRTAGSSGSFPTGGGGNDGELLYIGGDFRIGTGASGNDVIFISGTGYAERMRLDSSGRLGVGTSSPSELLDLSSGSSSILRLTNTDNALAVGQKTGEIYFYQSDSTGGGTGITGRIAMRSSVRPDTGAYFGTCADMGFYVSGDSNGSASNNASKEALTIRAGGNVGIGTTSPDAPLRVTESAVAQNSQTNDIAVFERNDAGFLKIYSPNNNTGGVAFGDPDDNFIGAVRYDHNDDNLNFYVNNDERVRIDSSGRLLVGTSSTSEVSRAVFQGNSVASTGTSIVKLTLGNASPGSTDELGKIQFADSSHVTAAQIAGLRDGGTWNSGSRPSALVFSTTADGASSPTERMRIRADGDVLIPEVYNNTTANAANGYVFSSGGLGRSTSSIKYKTNVETIEDQYSDALLNCRPVWYRSTCKSDCPQHGWWGFIAEEVAEIDPRLVHWKTIEITYDEKGSAVETPCDPEPEGVAYDRFVPHLLNLIKRQKEQIEAMEARLTAAGI